MAVTKAPASSGRHPRRAKAAQRRYLDGYRVANSVNAFGQFIKIGGPVLGLVVWAGVAQAVGAGAGGFVFGLMVAAIFFVIGVFVAAHGQLLKATLDTAVHSSPFLTNDLRAAVMSLPSGGRPIEGEVLEPPNDEPVTGVSDDETAAEVARDGADELTNDSFCYHCGAEVVAGSTKCQSCGKPL